MIDYVLENKAPGTKPRRYFQCAAVVFLVSSCIKLPGKVRVLKGKRQSTCLSSRKGPGRALERYLNSRQRSRKRPPALDFFDKVAR
jgi:hypothetical protein